MTILIRVKGHPSYDEAKNALAWNFPHFNNLDQLSLFLGAAGIHVLDAEQLAIFRVVLSPINSS